MVKSNRTFKPGINLEIPEEQLYFTGQLLKQTHATDLFLANMGSGRLTDGDARNSHSTGR